MKCSSIWAFIALFCIVVFAQLPEDTGPYDVACRWDTLYRPSSIDTTIREMVVFTWYPCIPILGIYDTITNSYLFDFPLPGDTARPVVVFSHGGCSHPLQSVYFTSHLASWGFIIVSTMHPGSMWGDPNCLDSAALHETWLNRPDDIIYSLDSIIALSRSNSNIIGVMDTSRMCMSGHSFGARTTFAVCNRQDWAKCAIPLSGGYDDVDGAPINCMEDIRGVHVPVLTMWGTYDFRMDDMLETYDTLDAPKYGIEIKRAGHFHFGDTCTSELDPLCGSDLIIPYDIAHTIVNHFAVSFLMKYLMSDERFAEYLCAEYDTFTTVRCDTTTSAIENIGNSIEKIVLNTFPNPFNSSCRIQVSGFRFQESGNLSRNGGIEIYDLRGNVVWANGVRPTDEGRMPYATTNRTFIWQPDESISSGIYLVRAIEQTTSVVCTKRIVYLK